MKQPTLTLGASIALGLATALAAAPVAAAPVTIVQIGTFDGAPGSGNTQAQMNTGNKFVMRTTYDAAVTPATTRTINGLDFRVIDLATRVAPADPITGQGGLASNGNSFDLLIPMEGLDTATPFVYQQSELNHLFFFNSTPQILFTAIQTTNPGDPNNLPPVTDPGLSAPGAPDFVGYEFEGDFAPGSNFHFAELFVEVANISGTREATFVTDVLDGAFAPAIRASHQPQPPPPAVVLAQAVVAEAGPPIVYDAGNLTRTTDASSQNNNLGNARTDKEDFVTYDWTVGGAPLVGTDVDGTETDVIPGGGSAPRAVENVNKAVAIEDSGLTNTTDSTVWQVEVNETLTGLGPSTDTTTVSYANTGPTANAGPPLVYDASTLSALADGSVVDPDLAVNAVIPGFESHTFQWFGSTPLGTTEDVLVAIQDSGLTTTVDTSVLGFTATDLAGESSSAITTASYTNALPQIANASATAQGAGDLQFAFDFSDPDLIVNALITDFELLDVLLLVDGANQNAFFADLIANGIQLVSNADLVSQFGVGPHVFDAFVTDRAGAVAAASFGFLVQQVQQQVPAPGTAALLALGLAGMLGGLRRRRRPFS